MEPYQQEVHGRRGKKIWMLGVQTNEKLVSITFKSITKYYIHYTTTLEISAIWLA